MNVAWRHLVLAAGSGALATVAFLLSPIGQGLPPLVLPWVPLLDLRLLLLPALFPWALFVASRARWPSPATSIVATALAAASASHVHASAALDYIGVGWAEPGARVNLVALAGSVGSLLVALHIALDLAGARFASSASKLGVPEEELTRARERGAALSQNALVTAGLAVAVLALLLRIVDQFTGRERLPLAEVLALALVLGVGALLLNLKELTPRTR